MDYEVAIAEHLACLRRPRPTLTEIRAREAEHRRAWDQETEQIAVELPELFRDGLRIGRWLRWAGLVLQARVIRAAEDAQTNGPGRAAWARACHLLEYAEVIMGAAMRWRIQQVELATPRLVIRNGKVEVLEPPPRTPAPPPTLARPLTLTRLADAIIVNAAFPLQIRWTPAERHVAARLAAALEATGQRSTAGMLRHVVGVFLTRDDQRQARLSLPGQIRRRDPPL